MRIVLNGPGRLIGRCVRMIVLACVLAGGVPAQADGVAFKGRDLSSYRPVREDEQVAYISHHDGVQHMIVAIRFDAADDEQGVWILPVPGDPESVAIDLQDEFPRLRGSDPRVDASRLIGNLGSVWRAWCVLPIPFEVIWTTLGAREVYVHEQVERWGIHTEKITATSAEALSTHLRSQNVDVVPEQLQTLTPYFDDQHVFIVTWIASVDAIAEEFQAYAMEHVPGQARTPCIYVRFPTDRPYFPLRPTSLYDTATVDLRLYVQGFATPQSDAASVSQRLRTAHYRIDAERARQVRAIRADLPPDADFDYTLVQGSFRGVDLQSDLWFDRAQPAHLAYTDFILAPLSQRLVFVFFTLMLVLLSYVSGGIAGLVTMRKWAGPAQIGCYNVLTLLGLWFALKHNNLAGDTGATETKLASRYCWVFFFVFVILATAVQFTLQAPLWSE